jgi:hypothetical protein
MFNVFVMLMLQPVFLLMLMFHSCYSDPALAHAGHSCAQARVMSFPPFA